MKFILKRKTYTKYDDTDRLKQMKDSDILAEKKRKSPGYGQAISAAGGAALVGGTVGGVVGGATGLFKKGASAAKFAGRYGKVGALAAGATVGLVALNKRNKAAKENEFYNDRLEYAQRQAKRREKKDWKTNMTQRESYTY
jgi:uncharacterized membrane protein YebE (DUF533 family)